MKYLYTPVLALLLMAPAAMVEAQSPTTRTAAGGSNEQSAATGVDLEVRNDLQIVTERVTVINEEIENRSDRVEDLIREINSLEPVIERTRTVTVTRYVTSGGPTSSTSGTSWGDGGSCFIAGTQVRMADGSLKNIEDVQIGDTLLGENGAHNKVLAFDHPKLAERQLYAINNDHHFVTEEHPFMTTEGWKSINPDATAHENPDLEVSKLEVGDVLVTYEAQNTHMASAGGGADIKGLVEIKSIKAADGDDNMTVYNFILDGNNTYYADDYLVHNKDGGGGGGGGDGGGCG